MEALLGGGADDFPGMDLVDSLAAGFTGGEDQVVCGGIHQLADVWPNPCGRVAIDAEDRLTQRGTARRASGDDD